MVLWVGANSGGLTDPTGTAGTLTLLGPFAAAAAAMGLGWWRAEKRNEHLQQGFDAMVPVLVEVKLGQQAMVASLNASTAANERLAQKVEANTAAFDRVAQVIPTNDELVRIRDMLAANRQQRGQR
jgi:hypothetical protein